MTDYKAPVLGQFEWQQPVLDKDLTAPPGGESKGDRYIVGAGATGAWSGEAGNIATYNGSGWDFATRREGMYVFVKDENLLYKYITSWTPAVGSGDVTAAANLTDNAIVRGDGGAKGVQTSGVIIDDSGRLIAPITIARAVGDSTLHVDTYDTSPSDFSMIKMRTSDSDVMGTLNKTEDGDTIGKLAWYGVDDANTWQEGAKITCIQDGASGTGEVPVNLVFETFSATAQNTNQLVLKKDGNVSISKNFILTSATSTITGGARLDIEAGATGIFSDTIMNDTVVAEANVRIGAVNAQLQRTTSARKYKDKITDLELDSSLIYRLRTVSFNSLCRGDDKKRRYHGLVADDIERIYPEIIDYNKDHEAESYDKTMLVTLILAETQRHEARIAALEAQLNN